MYTISHINNDKICPITGLKNNSIDIFVNNIKVGFANKETKIGIINFRINKVENIILFNNIANDYFNSIGYIIKITN